MLRFITGSAVDNIPQKMYGEIVSLFKGSEKPAKIIYVVPDQFVFETEKAIYSALEAQGLDRFYTLVSVTTFSALSREIIALADPQRARLERADDIVKSIIMLQAIKECEPDLSAFGGISRKPGFCSKMVNTVSMLRVSGITPTDLEQLGTAESGGEKTHSIIRAKLLDVGKIYAEYDAMLSQKYLDTLEVTALAADKLCASKYFSGARVFFDCFNDFTFSQMMFLSELIKPEAGADVTLGFVTEDDSLYPVTSPRRSVFYTINQQLSHLRGQAEENGTQVLDYKGALPERLEKGSAIRVIAEKLYTGKTDDTPTENIQLVSAYDVYQELDFVAAKIRSLTDSSGMKYSDIAVLCTDPAAYKSHIKSALDKYDIPYFCDIPEPILHQPLVNAILALLNLLRSFTCDNLISYIKTGFLSRVNKFSGRTERLSENDISAFESYITEWALNDEALTKPFTKGANGSSPLLAEEIRAAVAEPVLKLRSEINGRTSQQTLTELIYGFVCKHFDENRAQQALYMTRGDENPDNTLKSYQRLRNKVAEIFSAMYRGIGSRYISLDEYTQLFHDICAGTTLAKPPQNIDSLLVGDIDRTRVSSAKAVFIVGALYDLFPSETASDGIFSVYETEVIRQQFISINPVSKKQYCLKNAKEQYCLSLYRAYRAVTLPSEFLCITYSGIDLNGDTTERSQLVDDIARLCPNCTKISAAELPAEFYCRTLKTVKQRYAELLSCDDSEQRGILREVLSLAGEQDYPEKLDRLMSDRDSVPQHRLDPRVASKLFSRRISATTVENISLCRFMHFCKQGLRIKERTERTFNSIFRGNAVHYVMQKVLEAYSGNMAEFFRLDRRDISRLVNFYLEEYKRSEMADNFSDDRRMEFLYKNIAVAATDVLLVIQTEFASRKYRPKFCELSLTDGDRMIVDSAETEEVLPPQAALFDSETTAQAAPEIPARDTGKMLAVAPLRVELPDGTSVFVTGIVDRVDMFTDENGTDYLRVVDYKTNSRTFSLYNASNGINVQMVLYLFALCDAQENAQKNGQTGFFTVLAGGVGYTPAKVAGAQTEKSTAFRLLSSAHAQSGMLVRDDSTLAEISGCADFFAQKIKQELGELAEQAEGLPTAEDFLPPEENCPDRQQYEQFRQTCLEKITENIAGLFDGDISAMPLKYKSGGTKTPCSYCSYKAFCGNAGKVFNELPDEKALKQSAKKFAVALEAAEKSLTKANAAVGKKLDALQSAEAKITKKQEAAEKKSAAHTAAVEKLAQTAAKYGENDPKTEAARQKAQDALAAADKARSDLSDAQAAAEKAQRDLSEARGAVTLAKEKLAQAENAVQENALLQKKAGFLMTDSGQKEVD